MRGDPGPVARRGTRLTFLTRAGATLALTATLALGAGVAGASAPAVRATPVTLSPGATGIAGGLLTTLACPRAGFCEAAGSEVTAHRAVVGVVANERRGRWVAASELQAPANALGANPSMTATALACPVVGRCVVGGSYVTLAGDVHAFLDDQSGTAWARAADVALPANALGANQGAGVRSVACASAGACVAIGTYLDDSTTPRAQAFVDVEVRGRWGRAREVLTPTPANLDPLVTLVQVACASVTRCVAVGSYLDVNGVTQGLALTLDGQSMVASAVAPPINASSYAGTTLDGVTCLAQGPCTLVGTYNDAAGAVQPLIDSAESATWPPASALDLPASAGPDPRTLLYGYQGLSCASVGWCAVGGQYLDAAGRYQGFLALETGGRWHRATTMPLPAGAVSGGANGGVVSVACPAPGRCRAGGAYLDRAGYYQALLARQSGSSWTGARVTLPSGARSVGVDGGLYALACAGARACVGVGSYERGTTYQGFTLTG